MKKKTISLLSFIIVLIFCACALAAEPVQIVTLQGPTGIGMVKLMTENEGEYEFTLTAAPDEAVAAIVSGNADIAAVPTNLAATLYSKTEGQVRMLAVNTLGVLYILENGEEIQNVQDLAGKTVYATGQSATPEYVLDYILNANGLTDSVQVEYMAEHAELSTRMSAGDVTVALLPEPYVTSVLSANPEIRIALDVTKLYDDAAKTVGDNGTLSMGCVIARASFAEENPETVEAFLKAYAESVDFVNGDPAAASLQVAENGVMPNATAAEKAIPNCHIVCVTGNEMKELIEPFFGVLYNANPKAVGGKLPGEDLYWIPDAR